MINSDCFEPPSIIHHLNYFDFISTVQLNVEITVTINLIKLALFWSILRKGWGFFCSWVPPTTAKCNSLVPQCHIYKSLHSQTAVHKHLLLLPFGANHAGSVPYIQDSEAGTTPPPIGSKGLGLDSPTPGQPVSLAWVPLSLLQVKCKHNFEAIRGACTSALSVHFLIFTVFTLSCPPVRNVPHK